MMKSPQVMLINRLFPALLILYSISASANSAVQFSAAIGGEIIKNFNTGQLKIEKVILEKPHIFNESDLRTLLAKYEGKKITPKDLKQIQNALSRRYFDAGYVNSGVIVPDQVIKDGVIKLKAIHGRLTKIKISGNKEISDQYIHNKLSKGLAVPLNAAMLQKSLIELRQETLITDVKAHISPSDKLGQSIMQLQIKERSPYFVNAEANNHRSTSIGQYGISLYGGHRNLFGKQDTLQADMTFSEGLKDAGLDYSLPLTVESLKISAKFDYTAFTVVDPAFEKINVEGDTVSYGAELSYLKMKKTQAEVSGRIGLDVKKMTYSISGLSRENFSSPFVIGIDTLIKRKKFAAAAIAEIRRGVMFGLFSEEDELQQFTTGLGQLYLAFRPKKRIEWTVRLNGQLAADTLPAVEKFAIGGAKSVRGYKENIFVRDSGVTVSTQVKYPVYQSKVFVAPFMDYGRSWERNSGFWGGNADQALSIGAGVQWNISKKLYSELFWGHALLDVDTIDEIQQDNGFHFLLNYKIH